MTRGLSDHWMSAMAPENSCPSYLIVLSSLSVAQILMLPPASPVAQTQLKMRDA